MRSPPGYTIAALDHGNPLADDVVRRGHDARLVRGDELLASGEAHLVALGELVAVQAGLEKTPEDHELLIRERQLRRANEVQWFGDLAPEMRQSRRVEYGWHLGFLDSLTLRTASPRFQRDVTTSVAASFLRRIVVDLRDRPWDEPNITDGSLVDLVAPGIEEFEYRAHYETRAPVHGVVERATTWRGLTTLAIWLREEVDELPSLLEAYPRLEHLTVRRATNRALAAIAASPWFSRLKTLDIAYGTIDTVHAPERFSHLEVLRIRDNRLPAGEIAALKSLLHGRVDVGTQHPAGQAVSRRARLEELIRRDRMTELAVPEAVPFLIESLDGSRVVRDDILDALRALGPAALLASDPLAQHRYFAPLLWIDRERAEAQGAARLAPTRSRFCGQLRPEPRALAAHLRRLLEDDEVDVLLFALDGLADRSYLAELIRDEPDLVPIGHVRRLLAHDAMPVREAAAARLVDMHLPEDCDRVVAHLAAGHKVQPWYATWLGSHPDSEKVLAHTGDLRLAFHIVRRRRCAGLRADFPWIRRRVEVAFPASHHSSTGERDLEYASKIVRELRLTELAPLVASSLIHECFGDMLEALRATGKAGAAAIAKAEPTATGDLATYLGWARTGLESGQVSPLTLDAADALFLEGRLDDPTLIDSGAYGHYANILWENPSSAHAAFQIAWIERGYGSRITSARIAWLRALGVPAELLVDLEQRPAGIMPGPGPGFDRPPQEASPKRARSALDAGLPSVAATYLPPGSDDHESARRAAREHVSRVKAGCPS